MILVTGALAAATIREVNRRFTLAACELGIDFLSAVQRESSFRRGRGATFRFFTQPLAR
jgi:hypothetical protein